MFEGIVLFAHLLGFFCVMIPLWVLAPKVPLREVFGAPGFADFGGWGSIGAACVVGQLAASSAFVGVDSAAHMAEEVCCGRIKPHTKAIAHTRLGQKCFCDRPTNDARDNDCQRLLGPCGSHHLHAGHPRR